MPVIKLKRSSVIGKTPASSSLDFGELAINTKDGKIFLKRSGSGDTQTVWPVMVLGAQNTPMSGATTQLTSSFFINGAISASAYLGFEESLPILISGSFSDTQIPPIYVPTSMSFTNVQFALETGSCFIHVEVSGSTNGSLATGSITTQLPWGTINRITESVNRADEIVLKVTGSLSTEHLSVNLLFTRRN